MNFRGHIHFICKRTTKTRNLNFSIEIVHTFFCINFASKPPFFCILHQGTFCCWNFPSSRFSVFGRPQDPTKIVRDFWSFFFKFSFVLFWSPKKVLLGPIFDNLMLKILSINFFIWFKGLRGPKLSTLFLVSSGAQFFQFHLLH